MHCQKVVTAVALIRGAKTQILKTISLYLCEKSTVFIKFSFLKCSRLFRSIVQNSLKYRGLNATDQRFLPQHWQSHRTVVAPLIWEAQAIRLCLFPHYCFSVSTSSQRHSGCVGNCFFLVFFQGQKSSKEKLLNLKVWCAVGSSEIAYIFFRYPLLSSAHRCQVIFSQRLFFILFIKSTL